MYFSPTMQVFFVGDKHDVSVMPADCVEVDSETEKNIRELIISGNYVTISGGNVSATPRGDGSSS